jgi:colanic acid/amylovoran biosynthesis glycosyltransferase
MKITYIVGSLGLVSETFITDLIQGLIDRGDRLTIICNDRSPDFILSFDRIQIVKFLTLTTIIDRISYRFDYLWAIQQDIRRFRRQLDHAYRKLIPTLKQDRPDIVYVDFGTVAVFVRAACKDLNLPFVVHFHGADITSALNYHPYRASLQQVFVDAAALIVASDHLRRLLILEGAPAAKIDVIRYGVNIEGIAPLSWRERRELPPGVVFVGRFTPKKNPVALIEAFALVKQRVPTARLTVIGDGSEMLRVLARIEQLNLVDSVRLWGELPRSKAVQIVNRHWVYAQHSVTAPSGDQEGFGISLAEAAMLELPIVSTLHNGIPEQVIDGETGFLVREFDYEVMADKIVKLLLDPSLAEQMGSSGAKRISQMCQTAKRCDRIYSLLQTSMGVKSVVQVQQR